MTAEVLSDAVNNAIRVCRFAGFDLIIVRPAVSDRETMQLPLLRMFPYTLLLENMEHQVSWKVAALDFADLVVLNKFDRPGAEDALVEIRKQVRRNEECGTPMIRHTGSSHNSEQIC